MTYVLLIVGFIALIVGADWLVDGATSVGIRAKLSPLIIGLTIVAFGTSLPELIINVFSCAKGSSGLAIGNIVGSNIMNILFILGIASMIYPIDVSRVSLRRDVPAGFIATGILLLLANFFQGDVKVINWAEGIVLLICVGIYIWSMTYIKDSNDSEVETVQIPMPWGKTILYLLGGIGFLYLGGELVSQNAQKIALAWGMSESLVGLTIVAVATSLPELITSVVAATKKNAGIAIGNVLGSNIMNIVVVLGVSALITPLEFDSKMNFNLVILLAAHSLMLLFVFTGKGRKLSRFEGLIMTLAYLSFMTYTILG